MKATELFEAFIGLTNEAETQLLIEPITNWLIQNTEYHICKDDDELRSEAIDNTDLVEPG